MNEAVWIGARQYNGAWCWAGASELNGDTPPFLLADWEKPQPDGSGGIDSCVQVLLFIKFHGSSFSAALHNISCKEEKK